MEHGQKWYEHMCVITTNRFLVFTAMSYVAANAPVTVLVEFISLHNS